MAKLITRADDDITHLRGATPTTTLCGETVSNTGVLDGELTCPECARIALQAVELVTKSEKRDWRKL